MYSHLCVCLRPFADSFDSFNLIVNSFCERVTDHQADLKWNPSGKDKDNKADQPGIFQCYFAKLLEPASWVVNFVKWRFNTRREKNSRNYPDIFGSSWLDIVVNGWIVVDCGGLQRDFLLNVLNHNLKCWPRSILNISEHAFKGVVPINSTEGRWGRNVPNWGMLTFDTSFVSLDRFVCIFDNCVTRPGELTLCGMDSSYIAVSIHDFVQAISTNTTRQAAIRGII